MTPITATKGKRKGTDKGDNRINTDTDTETRNCKRYYKVDNDDDDDDRKKIPAGTSKHPIHMTASRTTANS
jgi:hypothetical protein